ncbi:hypothetical protein LOK49_LG13G00174 [Camellia lanceoleosa]|uniref:Uncharacterized protein n=1 Tax=Camellia lanceoleosa TaxID=1840588 RepID=A0ACC0FFP4_9ERIC|nr:hypothetical protein LOK49_LG13G00174 [Camellia lanceoleosa]
MCFETKGEAEDVRENLSKLKGDSFLKSCLIISHEKYYWITVDRFDYSLKRYCDINSERWEGSDVLLDPNQEKDTRYQLKPTYQQIVRDIITGIYQLHSQNYWDEDLSITDFLIVNRRAKFAVLRGARGGLPDKIGQKSSSRRCASVIYIDCDTLRLKQVEVNSLWVIPLHVEREYYLACACEELYCPPTAYFSLYGLTVQASFLGASSGYLLLVSHVTSKKLKLHTRGVALRRQEELIREEEALVSETELKTKRGAAEKEKKSKKKQV